MSEQTNIFNSAFKLHILGCTKIVQVHYPSSGIRPYEKLRRTIEITLKEKTRITIL